MTQTNRNFAQALPRNNGSEVALLPIVRYFLDLRLASTFILPENCGSVFHGGLGAALKTVADQTAYSYLFATSPPLFVYWV
jgi:hypothetical protein